MKVALAALVLVSASPTMIVTSVSAQEVLTNDAIVQMVRAGLPEGLIVAKIQSSQTKFDVRSETLIALKQSGVPDRILELMVAQPAQAASQSPPALPSTAPAQPAPPVAVTQPVVPLPFQIPAGAAMPPSALAALQGLGTGGTVYHVLGEKQVELTPVGAEIQTSRVPVIGYQKSELVLPGHKAGYRTAERQPVFLSTQSPSDMPLVRLKPGSDDRNLKFGSFSTVPFVGSTQRHGVRAQDRIDIEAERDGRGFYRIRPRKPLEPGEYGFIHALGFMGATSGKVFDFGVD